MSWLDLLRWVHVIGATLLLGGGSLIAFFMLMAHRSGDPAVVASTAGIVVVADWLFTATSMVLQPVTGIALALMTGWGLTEGWILLSLALYLVAGGFWLPVVAIQIRMRDLARSAAARGESLPPAYRRLFRIWFCCGFPGFGAVLAILWLMVAKPAIQW